MRKGEADDAPEPLGEEMLQRADVRRVQLQQRSAGRNFARQRELDAAEAEPLAQPARGKHKAETGRLAEPDLLEPPKLAVDRVELRLQLRGRHRRPPASERVDGRCRLGEQPARVCDVCTQAAGVALVKPVALLKKPGLVRLGLAGGWPGDKEMSLAALEQQFRHSGVTRAEAGPRRLQGLGAGAGGTGCGGRRGCRRFMRCVAVGAQ